MVAPPLWSPSWLMGFAEEPWGAHNQRLSHGPAVVSADGINEASSWFIMQKKKSQETGWPAQNDFLFHWGTKYGHFKYFRYLYFSLLLEKCNVNNLRREDREGAVSLVASVGARPGVEESGHFRQPLGLGDLTQRYEPHVPKDPKCHSAIRPDHQVSDAAIGERETEPALWRELKHPAHDVADDIGMAVCWVDIVPEDGRNPGPISVIHSHNSIQAPALCYTATIQSRLHRCDTQPRSRLHSLWYAASTQAPSLWYTATGFQREGHD